MPPKVPSAVSSRTQGAKKACSIVGTVARDASPRTVGFTGTGRHASRSNPASLACAHMTKKMKKMKKKRKKEKKRSPGVLQKRDRK